MDKMCMYLRGVNIKKAAFGSPSLLSLIFTLFVSFEYITGFIAELYEVIFISFSIFEGISFFDNNPPNSASILCNDDHLVSNDGPSLRSRLHR